MKRAIAVLLSVMLFTGMAGCGKKDSIPNWNQSDFVFQTGDKAYTVSEKMTLITYPGQSMLMAHESEDYELLDESFCSSRGLKIGDSFQDFIKLYPVKDSYAVWEVVDKEKGTRMLDYKKETPGDLYQMDNAGAVWLDIAFEKKGDTWEPLSALALKDIWFCEAEENAYNEVSIFSILLKEDEEIAGMACYHIVYDSSWEIWQSWEK